MCPLFFFFGEIKNHRCKVIMLRLQMAARAHWVLGSASYSSLGLWVRPLSEVLLCPKTLECQTLAPKWREESKGQLHW